MLRHDTLWKSLLQAFFPDFLELIVPDLVGELNLDECSFLEQEVFSDPPDGRRAQLDVVAKVPGQAGSAEIIIIHIEIERRFGLAMDRRMQRYFMQLSLKYDLPVAPIVLFLQGGPAGVVVRTVEDFVGTHVINTFSYWALGLSASRSEDFLDSSPLGSALASCARGDALSAEERKYRCMVAVLDAQVDEPRRFLLLNAVETYLELEGEQEVKYAERVASSARNQEIVNMEMTWAEKIELRGKATGLREGRRELLERLLQKRFGELPASILARLAQIQDSAELERVGERLLEAETLNDLGLSAGASED